MTAPVKPPEYKFEVTGYLKTLQTIANQLLQTSQSLTPEGMARHFANEWSTVYNNVSESPNYSTWGKIYTIGAFPLADLFGVRGVSDAFSTHDAVDAHVQSTTGWALNHRNRIVINLFMVC